MKWVIAGLIGILCLGLEIETNAQVRKVIGTSADDSVPPLPNGSCNGVFSMTYDGTLTVPLSTVDAGSFVTFRAAPLENSFEGVGYGVVLNVANTVYTLLTFSLGTTPVSVTGSIAISTANVPDVAVDSYQSVVYDTNKVGADGFIILGRQVTAPCNIAQCVHIRGFTNLTAGVSIQDTSISISSVNLSYVIPGDSYWTVATDAGVAGQVLRKYTTGYTSVGSVAALNPGDSYISITHDDTFVYAVTLLGGVYNIRKINRSTLAVSDTAYSAVVKSSIFYVDGFLYVGESGSLVKINASTMVVVSTLALNVNEVLRRAGSIFDLVNNRLYVVTGTLATATSVRRINLSTFTNEQTLSFAAPSATDGVGFDLQHKRIWTANNSGNLMQLSKVSLCS